MRLRERCVKQLPGEPEPENEEEEDEGSEDDGLGHVNGDAVWSGRRLTRRSVHSRQLTRFDAEPSAADC